MCSETWSETGARRSLRSWKETKDNNVIILYSYNCCMHYDNITVPNTDAVCHAFFKIGYTWLEKTKTWQIASCCRLGQWSSMFVKKQSDQLFLFDRLNKHNTSVGAHSCWTHLVSLSLGQSTVRLYGQTDQVLSQSFLRPAQRHEGLRLTNMTLHAGRRCITYLTSTWDAFHILPTYTGNYIFIYNTEQSQSCQPYLGPVGHESAGHLSVHQSLFIVFETRVDLGAIAEQYVVHGCWGGEVVVTNKQIVTVYVE